MKTALKTTVAILATVAAACAFAAGGDVGQAEKQPTNWVAIGMFAAFVAATFPVFGMSWFFDTENWAASLWNRWAETRTDTWREAMVAAVSDHEPRAGAEAFAVSPPGVAIGCARAPVKRYHSDCSL